MAALDLKYGGRILHLARALSYWDNRACLAVPDGCRMVWSIRSPFASQRWLHAWTEQVIRKTCLSSHFGMIGQRLPTADEPVRFITAVSTPPGFGCKGLFSRVFGMPPPEICTTVPDPRPRVGEVSQKHCD